VYPVIPLKKAMKALSLANPRSKAAEVMLRPPRKQLHGFE